MKKFIWKGVALMMVFVLLRPPTADAQPYCPLGVYNNTTTIGMVNSDLYNAFQGSAYKLTMISSQLADMSCWLIDVPVTVTKTQNVMGAITNNASSGGWGIYFDISAAAAANGCTTPLPTSMAWNAIQGGFLSIILTPVPGQGGNTTITLNITDFNQDECAIIVVPVVWGPFSTTLLTFPNRVRLNWTTYTEQDVNHFTIEKSINGTNFYKIAEVAAVGNSTAQNNYQYIDNSPNSPRGYYRVVAVDNDCSRNVSLTRYTNCTGCATTFNPPAITPDCPPPNTNPYIGGPSSICDNAGKIYHLYNVTGDAQVTWSINSYYATLKQASRSVGVIPTGNSGITTLTATVVKNGVTSQYNITIVFGVPAIFGSCVSSEPHPWDNSVDFTATVFPLPGTYPLEYKWYMNGNIFHQGSSYTWYSLQHGQNLSFEVRYTGPCGQSVWSGTTVWVGTIAGCGLEKGVPQVNVTEPVKTPSVRYKLMQNPAGNKILIQRMSSHAAGRPVTIRVFDVQGALRKTSSVSASGTWISIDAGDLSAGLYFIHLAEEGQKTETLRVVVKK